MIEWAKFGYWETTVGQYLGEWITFDFLESLYNKGFYMVDYNHAIIPLERFKELRCLHERSRSNIFSSSDGVSHSQISSEKR